MKTAVTTLLALIALVVALVSPASAGGFDDQPWPDVADGIIVQIPFARPIGELARAVDAVGFRPVIQSEGLWLLRFAHTEDLYDLKDLEKLAKQVEKHRFEADGEKAVIFAEAYSATGMLVDGTRMSSWHDGSPEQAQYAQRNGQPAAQVLMLDDVHAASTGANVRLAVLDTGIQPMDGLDVVGGYDFVDDDNDPADVGNGIDDDGDGLVDEALGHGTHVAGIAALTAPDVQILAYRVLEADGSGNAFAVAAAIDRAIADGADIVNMSFGTLQKSDWIKEAVKRAKRAGVVVVAAAGNTGDDEEVYPAAFSQVIGTGSVTVEGQASTYSAHGSWVDIYAPAENIISVLPDGTLAAWSGTSMAAPFVSGQAAVLLSLEPDADPDDVWKAIKKSARDFDDIDGHKSQSIDIHASIRRLLEQ